MDVAGVLPEAIINNLITCCHANSFDKVQQVVCGTPLILVTTQTDCCYPHRP